MNTTMDTTASIKRSWHIVDADGKVMGDLASEVATLLIGKHKITYTPHIDNGDHVVVINVEKIVLTGKKSTDKVYRSHSGRPGGLKEITYDKLMEKKPDYPFRHAVKGMLPKNKLQSNRIARLHVYVGTEHPHTSQIPTDQIPQ